MPGLARLAAATCFALVAFHVHPLGAAPLTLLGIGLALLALSPWGG